MTYEDLVPEKPMNDTKTLKTSKTFWMNLAVAATGVATYLSGTDLIQNMPQVASIFETITGVLEDPQTVGTITTLVGVAGIVLRVFTKKPVKILK